MQDGLFIPKSESEYNEIDDLRNTVQSLESEIEGLKKNFNHRLVNMWNEFEQRLEYMQNLVPKPKAKKSELEFAWNFPEFETLTQIKAQLFHNKPDGSGKHGGARKPIWNLKVGFWTCPIKEVGKWEDGMMDPFWFPLYPKSHAFKVRQTEPTMLSVTVADPTACLDLIGPRKLYKYGVVNNEYDGDQLAGITPDRALLLGASNFPNLKLRDKIPPKKSDSEQTPVEIWLWRPAT